MPAAHRGIRLDLCRCAAAALLAAGCGTGDTLTTQSFGAVVTVVDSGGALRSARTFALPDTVVAVRSSRTPVSPAMARQLVAEVRAHLVALGWTDVSVAAQSTPDVLVLVAASTQVQTGILYTDWFSAWGYLPYWGSTVDPSWAWGAPAGMVEYSFQTGSMLVAMIDIRAPRGDAKVIPMLWAAGLDGLVGEGTTLSRIRAGIDQAFEQSPYLRVN